MKPELQQIDASDTAGVIQAVEADGACIARNMLPADLCDALIMDFDQHLNDAPWGIDEIGYQDEFYGSKTKRLHGLFSKSPRMVEVLMRPMLIALAQKLLIDSGIANDIRLSNAELMVLGADQGNQAFHSDAGSWSRVQKMETNEILISANCALTDFTETNGATRVVPGSHHWESGRVPQDNEVCLAVMPKGSALIYSGNAIHSGGANQEDKIRIGLYLGYIASWLRPIENQLITNKPEDIFKLSEEAQRMLDVSPGGITIFA